MAVGWSFGGLVRPLGERIVIDNRAFLLSLDRMFRAAMKDPVVLAALRQSAVLYATIVLGTLKRPPQPRYVWQVDPAMCEAAQCFVDTFNSPFDEHLPAPNETNAAVYARFNYSSIVGRCVRLGSDRSPTRHYHWAVDQETLGDLMVREFWAPEIWTTERYRETDRSRRPSSEATSSAGALT